MFTTNHFIWLGICAVIIFGLTYFTVHYKVKRTTCYLIMAGVALVSEMVKLFTHIQFANGTDWTDGGYILVKSLPLHLCSLFIFVFFYLAVDQDKHLELNDKLINFFVPIGITAGTLALLLATSGTDFKDPSSYQSFIYHSCMVWLALYFMLTKQVNLIPKVYLRNCVCLFALAIVMIWVNGALRNYDVNFFFVVYPPAKNLPILNLNHGWHIYFLNLSLTGVLLETLVSLPYMIKYWKQAK